MEAVPRTEHLSQSITRSRVVLSPRGCATHCALSSVTVTATEPTGVRPDIQGAIMHASCEQWTPLDPMVTCVPVPPQLRRRPTGAGPHNTRPHLATSHFNTCTVVPQTHRRAATGRKHKTRRHACWAGAVASAVLNCSGHTGQQHTLPSVPAAHAASSLSTEYPPASARPPYYAFFRRRGQDTLFDGAPTREDRVHPPATPPRPTAEPMHLQHLA